MRKALHALVDLLVEEHRRVRILRNLPALASKQPLATLLKRSASTLSLALKHELYGLDLFDQLLEFREFSLRQLFPTLGGRGAVAKAKEKLANLIERETDLTRSLERDQTVKRGLVVSSLAANPMRGRQNANLFVVANR